MEIWKISKDRGLRLHSARALVMLCSLPFWEDTSYSAECEVSSSLSYLGFPEPPSDKRKRLHTFVFVRQVGSLPIRLITNEKLLIVTINSRSWKRVENEMIICSRGSLLPTAFACTISAYCTSARKITTVLLNHANYYAHEFGYPFYTPLLEIDSSLNHRVATRVGLRS